MDATDTLKHEHRIVLLVLDAVEREAQALRWLGRRQASPSRRQASRRVRRERIEQMLDFSRSFIDRCHHAKEEKHLFPLLQRRGVTGPVSVLLAEHEQGRAIVKVAAELLPRATDDPTSAAALAENLQAYARLLREHIEKEDGVLFPMGEKLLTSGERQELVEAFERIEREEMGEGVHEKYHRLAHELAES